MTQVEDAKEKYSLNKLFVREANKVEASSEIFKTKLTVYKVFKIALFSLFK